MTKYFKIINLESEDEDCLYCTNSRTISEELLPVEEIGKLASMDLFESVTEYDIKNGEFRDIYVLYLCELSDSIEINPNDFYKIELNEVTLLLDEENDEDLL